MSSELLLTSGFPWHRHADHWHSRVVDGVLTSPVLIGRVRICRRRRQRTSRNMLLGLPVREARGTFVMKKDVGSETSAPVAMVRAGGEASRRLRHEGRHDADSTALVSKPATIGTPPARRRSCDGPVSQTARPRLGRTRQRCRPPREGRTCATVPDFSGHRHIRQSPPLRDRGYLAIAVLQVERSH